MHVRNHRTTYCWCVDGAPGFRGTPEDERRRFWARVEKTDSCWLWRGPVQRSGHGHFNLDVARKRGGVLAHVYSYESAKGPVPPGLEIDHLCRVTRCVNPDHLESVTRQINQHRSGSVSGRNAQKAECPRGHGPYTVRADGDRHCVDCKKAAARRGYWRNRDSEIQRMRDRRATAPKPARRKKA